MTEEERKLLEEIEAKASDAKSAADEFKRELLLERLALRLDPTTTLKLVEWIRRLEAENAFLADAMQEAINQPESATEILVYALGDKTEDAA